MVMRNPGELFEGEYQALASRLLVNIDRSVLWTRVALVSGTLSRDLRKWIHQTESRPSRNVSRSAQTAAVYP